MKPLDLLRAIWKPSDPRYIPELTSSQRAVLSVLVMHASRAGRARPSVDTMAEGAGLGRSTVVRALTALVAQGFLLRTSRRPRPTLYTLVLQRLVGTEKSHNGPVTVSERVIERPRAEHELLKKLPTSLREMSGGNLSTDVAAVASTETADTSNWVGQAAAAWKEVLKGTPPYGRIGKALKPLVDEHGAPTVVRVWRRYLSQEPGRYVTPEQFASKYGTWESPRGESSRMVTKVDRNDIRGWQTGRNGKEDR